MSECIASSLEARLVFASNSLRCKCCHGVDGPFPAHDTATAHDSQKKRSGRKEEAKFSPHRHHGRAQGTKADEDQQPRRDSQTNEKKKKKKKKKKERKKERKKEKKKTG